MLPGETRITCAVWHMFPAGLDLYAADPAQGLTAAGDELDHLHMDQIDQIDHDMSDVWEVGNENKPACLWNSLGQEVGGSLG